MTFKTFRKKPVSVPSEFSPSYLMNRFEPRKCHGMRLGAERFWRNLCKKANLEQKSIYWLQSSVKAVGRGSQSWKLALQLDALKSHKLKVFRIAMTLQQYHLLAIVTSVWLARLRIKSSTRKFSKPRQFLLSSELSYLLAVAMKRYSKLYKDVFSMMSSSKKLIFS